MPCAVHKSRERGNCKNCGGCKLCPPVNDTCQHSVAVTKISCAIHKSRKRANCKNCGGCTLCPPVNNTCPCQHLVPVARSDSMPLSELSKILDIVTKQHQFTFKNDEQLRSDSEVRRRLVSLLSNMTMNIMKLMCGADQLSQTLFVGMMDTISKKFQDRTLVCNDSCIWCKVSSRVADFVLMGRDDMVRRQCMFNNG